MSKTILIVEDDKYFAQILCAMVALSGWVPLVETTMAGALRAVKMQDIPVVILDLSLPDSLATESLERIAALKGNGSKVIIITGAVVTPLLILTAKVCHADGIYSKDDIRGPGMLESVIGKPVA